MHAISSHRKVMIKNKEGKKRNVKEVVKCLNRIESLLLSSNKTNVLILSHLSFLSSLFLYPSNFHWCGHPRNIDIHQINSCVVVGIAVIVVVVVVAAVVVVIVIIVIVVISGDGSGSVT
jgi:hypothetical protein